MIPVSEAVCIHLNAVVKARKEDSSGKRIVEVQCSSEDVDAEGDVVLQKALLDSAPSFIRTGHLDIDHLSEIGSRVGIRDPDSYIVGRPIEVNDLGGKKTGLVGEIMRSADGMFSTEKNRFDAFWKSLQSDPPVQWSASIYGFPNDVEDCTEKSCSTGATRYVIKSLDWRSTAFTRNPINQSLSGYAKVVTAKAMIDAIHKDGLPAFAMGDGLSPFALSCPMNMDHVWGQFQRHGKACPHMKNGNSVLAFTNHFKGCCGASGEQAEILAHALMYSILRDRKHSMR
jgi:hypothetical protein